MPFLTNVPLPQCLQHGSATRRLLARDHDRGCMRYLLKVKCLCAWRYLNRTLSGMLLVVTAAACLGRVALLPLASSTPAPTVGEPAILIGDVPPDLPLPALPEPSADAA